MTEIAITKKRSKKRMWPFDGFSLSAVTAWGEAANIALLFSLLVGVTATFIIVRTTNVKEHHWDEARNKAAADIALARKETAEANARAKEAELALVNFRKSRSELLTHNMVAAITEKLSAFAGTKFDVGHERTGREVWDFLWKLEPAISKAGWVLVDWVGGNTFRKNGWPGNHAYGVGNVSNVSIELKEPNDPKLRPAADALAAALKDAGIEATVTSALNSSTNTDVIHLLVGPKR